MGAYVARHRGVPRSAELSPRAVDLLTTFGAVCGMVLIVTAMTLLVLNGGAAPAQAPAEAPPVHGRVLAGPTFNPDATLDTGRMR